MTAASQSNACKDLRAGQLHGGSVSSVNVETLVSVASLMSKVFRVLKKKLGLKKSQQEANKSGKPNALCMDDIRPAVAPEQTFTDSGSTQLDSGVGSLSLSAIDSPENSALCSVWRAEGSSRDSVLQQGDLDQRSNNIGSAYQRSSHRDPPAFPGDCRARPGPNSREDQHGQTENSAVQTQKEPGLAQTEFRPPCAGIAGPGECPANPSSGPVSAASRGEMSASDIFPSSVLNTPIAALRKSRERLCLWLNIEHLAVDGDLTPDYMGLAELLGFEAIEIQNFWERNPTHDLFVNWIGKPEKQPYLWKLVECLKKLGRQDVLDECQGLILEDVRNHIAELNILGHYTVGRLSNFDCYVNIADEDLMTIGREIIDTLEGVYGLRLCLTLRDVTLGGFEYENMATMLETRCNSKVVIILSKYYDQSDACQFLTQFAVTLDPGSRRNKLIPVLVDEDVFIPRVLRCLAILNYHRDRKLGFLWPRLCAAIKQ